MNKEYHFFWGGEFSNWYEAPFGIEGVTYNCVEQYMMAAKAQLFKDSETLQAVMTTKSPREQKALGRKVKGFVPEQWDKVSCMVVYDGNLAKYLAHESLRNLLLSTGDKVLVEASPYDRIWGIGFSEEDALANIGNWGSNKLGQVLMAVREDLLYERKNQGV